MLKGKNALVTGSTSGIGRGMALKLAEAGANIMLNGFGAAEEIADLRRHIETTYKVGVDYHGADLSRVADIEDMMKTAAAKFGLVDILINNAGIQHTAPTEAFPVDKWDAVIAINLSSAFHASRLAIPAMKAAGWGRIINTASVHGLVGSVHKVAYVAAKHGIVGMTKVVALELAGSGVTCNAIAPGWVATPLVQKQIDARAAAEGISVDEARKKLLGEKQPSMAFAETDQLGALAVFLSSPAADQITGITLPMDGGWTAQ
ncbi:3-hydroxybutyrate dehydrogenase [Elstera cyanobacteriorum]|uniref:3-hydroxybutyrate dehydrogenase n=1 Tax=Elstera cyanobacteriorum TaxID=2022747 RepID=A0A255XI24_9PROT|nr:3-hydroxybutyrate dehydrogenase [Elstera cyanobacteriorum]OYQ16643.1 3-hydroxybutyrate dehydrogenase [Elstera cyanobacteriorum]GFZ87447.1 3-hydroxybutyrate dehydrogenase [Elstera cyanobacteriorum]